MFWPFRRGSGSAGGTSAHSADDGDDDDVAPRERDIETPESSGNSRKAVMARTSINADAHYTRKQGVARRPSTSDSGFTAADSDINAFFDHLDTVVTEQNQQHTNGSKPRQHAGQTGGPFKQLSLPKMAWKSPPPEKQLSLGTGADYHEDASVQVYRAKPLHGASPRAGGVYMPHATQAPATPAWVPPRLIERQPSDEAQGKVSAAAAAAAAMPPPPPRQPLPAVMVPGVPLPVPMVVCMHPGPGPAAAGRQAHHQEPPSPAPCPLRPGPPSSSGMRTESFTSGTRGKLLRPGVGIGAGTMREARYCDLRLIQQIGEGGFGKVYYGHWSGVPVAIKMANPGEDSERQLQEFQREVTNMSTIPPHPNVLKLLGACMEPPHLALVTEFCSRGSLYGMLHAPGAAPLLPHQMLSIWLGVARGMQHLHACRVLHRDLKSANLLIDDVGSVKIGDFGLSRLCGSTWVAMTGALGTYQWMAPEVLTSQRYSEKADVYSFGMVMWECITRKLPYEGMTALQAGLGVATLGLRPEIPQQADLTHADLIRACWAPVSDQRPSFMQIVLSLEAMQAALEKQRRGTPMAGTLAGPPGESVRTPLAKDTLLLAGPAVQQQQQQQQQPPLSPEAVAPEPERRGSSHGTCTLQQQHPLSPDAVALAPLGTIGTWEQGPSPLHHQQQLPDTLPGHVPDREHAAKPLRQEQRQWLRQEQAQACGAGRLLGMVRPLVGPPPRPSPPLWVASQQMAARQGAGQC